MAFDPNLGYDPTQNAPRSGGAQTREQWIATQASAWTMAYANGTTDAFPAELFADTYWNSVGIQVPPDEAWGATAQNPNNAVSPLLYQQMHAFATYMANNPQEAGARGLQVPNLPSGGPVLDPNDQARIYDATQRGLDRTSNEAANNANNTAAMDRLNTQNTWQGGQNDAARAQQMAIANLEQSGMDRRLAEEIAGRMSIAQLQEAGADGRAARQIAAELQMNTENNATQRYGIDKTAEVAGADRVSREGIANADRTSRESIATADRTESARQFDFRLGEDRRQFNTTMAMDLFKTGIELAKQPVDWLGLQYYQENLGIPMSFLNVTAVAGLVGAVAPTGPSPSGPVTGGPGMLDGEMTLSARAGVQPRFVPLQEALQANPGDTQNPYVVGSTFAASSQGWGDLNSVQQEMDVQREEMVFKSAEFAGSEVVRAAREEKLRTGVQAGMAPQINAGQPVNSGMNLPPIPGGAVTTAGAQPATMENRAAADSAGGIFTAAASAAQSAAPPQVQGQSNMTDLMKNIAASLGMPEADVYKLIDPNLLPPSYSRDAVTNSPLMQTLMNGGDRMSQFRTADPNGQKFGQIQSLGIDTGLRGGQDVNANLLINNSQVNKDMLQGVAQGMGMNWEDFQRQSYKASPVSGFAVGSSGRRR